MKEILPLPKLPAFQGQSPQVVKVLDKIRMEIGNEDEKDCFHEFCWFAREYPRIYRHHLNCAENRLGSIYNMYLQAQVYFEENLDRNSRCFEKAYLNRDTSIMYWDFESFLSAINTSLDVLARIVGAAYAEQTPLSFNKLCKRDLDGIAKDFVNAKRVWVSKMKDYRDCFTHYTCADTVLSMRATLYSDGWEIRAKLPANPNSRDIALFRYFRRPELLRYAISTFKHMVALDKLVAKRIYELYRKNSYPQKITNLLFLGKRE